MPARVVGVGRVGWRMAAGMAVCSLALGCATDEGGEFESLASGTVTGSVTGTGSAPLDSILIELTVPSQVSSLFAIAGGGGRTDVEGRFSVPVDVVGAEIPRHCPTRSRSTSPPPRCRRGTPRHRARRACATAHWCRWRSRREASLCP